jgi:acyl-CoA synthetase (AMP-forming)/AMP-acid ligase II
MRPASVAYVPRSSLHRILRTKAEQHANRTAFFDVATSERVSYARLHEAAQRFGAFLDMRGVGHGDRVLLATEQSWAVFPLLAACTARGVGLVPVNARLHPDEMRFILEDAEPKVVLSDDLPRPELSGDLVIETRLGEALQIDPSPTTVKPDDADADARRAALFIYTSGTTGSPKAVVLTEANLSHMAWSLRSFYSVRETDHLLSVLPVYHMNALMITGWLPLVAGAEVTIAPLAELVAVLEDAPQRRLTIASFVPSILRTLIDLKEAGYALDLGGLRFCFSGAAPLPSSLWMAFEETFGVPVYQGYGLTETTTWATFVPPDEPRRYDTVGRPVDCEIRIEPKNDGPSEVTSTNADGDRFALGEILIRGPLVMKEYHRRPELTAAQLGADGFFRSGDIGYLDDGGFLHVSGRVKEVIIRNAINVFPEECDVILRRHPAIKDCKTFGLLDPRQGEAIATALEIESGQAAPAPAALQSFFAEHGSPYKCPDFFYPVERLPRTPTGKVIVPALRRACLSPVVPEVVAALGRGATAFDGLEQAVSDALAAGRPVEFVVRWRDGAFAENDVAALEAVHAHLALAECRSFVVTRTHLIVEGWNESSALEAAGSRPFRQCVERHGELRCLRGRLGGADPPGRSPLHGAILVRTGREPSGELLGVPFLALPH